MMAHRKKANERRKADERRQKRERRPAHRLADAVKEHRKTVVVLTILLAVIVLVGIFQPEIFPQNPNACFGASAGPSVQAYGVAIFLQTGNATQLGTQFIRIPNGFGINKACQYAIHVTFNDPAGRGPYFTPLDVAAPNLHAYTLGDFFAIWGHWLGDRGSAPPATPIAFGPDRLEYYKGDVIVRVCPNVGLSSEPWAAGCHTVSTYADTPLQSGAGYYINIRDPFTNTTNPFG
jgi:hypothetical protein